MTILFELSSGMSEGLPNYVQFLGLMEVIVIVIITIMKKDSNDMDKH